MPASENEAARSQPDEICSEAACDDVALPLLMDRTRIVEDCLDSFIDTAAKSLENDPKRSTHHSEPTLYFAMNFDRDALSFGRTAKRKFERIGRFTADFRRGFATCLRIDFNMFRESPRTG